MQAFRLVIFTVIGLIIGWFIIMTVDLQLFLNTNVDSTVTGAVAINQTDIEDRCGSAYLGSLTQVDYKLNSKGQIVYLCPVGLWPIRNRVVATTITQDFRKLLTPLQLTRLNQFYALPQAPAQVFNPIVQPQPMSATTPTLQPTVTQTVQTTTTTTTPASPAAVPPQPEPVPGAPITPPSPSTPILPETTPAQPTTVTPTTPNMVTPSEPITVPPSPNPPPLVKPTIEQTTTTTTTTP